MIIIKGNQYLYCWRFLLSRSYVSILDSFQLPKDHKQIDLRVPKFRFTLTLQVLHELYQIITTLRSFYYYCYLDNIHLIISGRSLSSQLSDELESEWTNKDVQSSSTNNEVSSVTAWCKLSFNTLLQTCCHRDCFSGLGSFHPLPCEGQACDMWKDWERIWQKGRPSRCLLHQWESIDWWAELFHIHAEKRQNGHPRVWAQQANQFSSDEHSRSVSESRQDRSSFMFNQIDNASQLQGLEEIEEAEREQQLHHEDIWWHFLGTRIVGAFGFG